tara:strand:+ start:7596 stop:8345 length:750 start_codon:yes stop_codon:yes gene_type:complete
MLVDIHCHLYDEAFSKDINKVIEKAEKNDVSHVICAGLNQDTNKKTLELSKRFSIVKSSLGLYPLDAINLNEDKISETLDFISKNKNKIIAISEVGLDFKDENSNFKKQKQIFEKIITLTERLKLPIIVHSRKAEKECIEMLQSSKIKKIIMHSFTGKFNLVKQISDNNWNLSIPANVTHSTHFQNIVDKIDISQLLTETDSPYLSPNKLKRNEPSNIIYSIKKISKIKNLTIEETKKIIFFNFQKIFL